jgi:hypothetical protein
MNISRGFNNNNSVNNIRVLLLNKNRVNMTKLTRMLNVVNKYSDVLDNDILEIFIPTFNKLFRKNINNISINSQKSRVLNYNGDNMILNAEIYNKSIPGKIILKKIQ